MSENSERDSICRLAKSLFDRGLTIGSSGNISVRLADGWLMTPTGSSMGNLDPNEISKLDLNGKLISGKSPTKESFLHIAMYDERPDSGAVVHLHSTHSVAVSCLAGIDKKNVLPPITAYYVMKIGKLPLVPYFPPGDINLAKAVKEMASNHHAVLLANHGPVVAGKTLEDAVYAIEELEETARLFLLLRNMKTQYLNEKQVKTLEELYPN
ncbi:MAG: aldolase [Rhodospirillaceae bacterium]|jgi:ribulose-5-phosphate 4-epimerase/fuculose-1-phosphate aldolase|nr:aldolase [Rhodospirillaceae bacterium]MAR88909.1 aldolase [Rhodospirillaceae bacterium]OUU55750.1 MAG: aldolase [Candidatus Endolissoclinum sp. TMED55]|tara:strand:- start:73 stop:705 length:633 start_codon:yes stop_codon:yes gene_type:complete